MHLYLWLSPALSSIFPPLQFLPPPPLLSFTVSLCSPPPAPATGDFEIWKSTPIPVAVATALCPPPPPPAPAPPPPGCFSRMRPEGGCWAGRSPEWDLWPLSTPRPRSESAVPTSSLPPSPFSSHLRPLGGRLGSPMRARETGSEAGRIRAAFHVFSVTHREAERLLETEPQGCYLVRFSESAVTFVLTYRSRTCCRHFLLAQLRDGRHVVLGEDSAHARLQDLLLHYTAGPLSPYGEKLTEPLPRQTPEPVGLSLRTEESDSGSKSQDSQPQYSPILKKEQSAAFKQKEGAGEPKEPTQPPRPKPRIPARPHLPPEVYTSPAPRPRPTPPHKPSNPIYHEPDEPIAFYAMGRGSPGEAPSNIYAEVEVKVPDSGGESPPRILRHEVLRKCQSRPVLGSQNPGSQQLHSQNSVAEPGLPLPHQPLPRWGHTLPHNLPRQVLQDRGQAWLPLGPPQ
uniref:SH2 domain containing 2A n=1 Tax=Sus scrofa TaxID=9823 RepID=A0A4X1VYB3_PIG